MVTKTTLHKAIIIILILLLYNDSVCFPYFVLDIDECRLGIDNCEQVCRDTDGSYVCECFSGYNLNNDGRTCDGM